MSRLRHNRQAAVRPRATRRAAAWSRAGPHHGHGVTLVLVSARMVIDVVRY